MDDIKEFTKNFELLYNKSDDKSKTSLIRSMQTLLDELTTQTTQTNKEFQNETFLFQEKADIIDEYLFMTISDLDGKILDISQAYLNFTGFSREDVIGQNHNIFRNHSLNKKVLKNLWDTLSEDKVWKGDLKNTKASGEEYWIHTIIKPLYDDNNIKTGYISLKHDITTKKRLEEFSTLDNLTLLENNKQFDYSIKKAVNHTYINKENVALILISIDYYQEYLLKYGDIKANKVILDVAKSIKLQLKSTIYSVYKISELEFAIIIDDKEDKYLETLAEKILDAVRKLQIPNSQSKTSDYLTLSIGISNIDTYKYKIASKDLYDVASMNLKEAKRVSGDRYINKLNLEHIVNLKNIDNITKLSNRSLFMHDLSILNDNAMLIILHINQIKELKELYGFEFISRLIAKKAEELSNIITKTEASLYSLNLQEFAILVTDKNLFSKYFSLLEHSILTNDYDNDDDSNITSYTAGIAYGLEDLFNHADLVLQDALLYKLQYRQYNSSASLKQLQESNLNRLKVYKNALHLEKIIPYFQPIIDSNSGEIMKYEALARLETDDGEIISPYYFLDSAKEDKTFEYFTRQMMQKVFNIYAKNDIKISLNLTYENINSSTMIEYIQNRLEKYGGSGITFEILESEDILDYDSVANFITMVKKYGCKISIDDFGSGYSNFTNIIKLDIDYIKLDGSLIQKLNTDTNVQHMINGLLVYTKNAKIKTIAEFVSTQELSDAVKALGIDYMQGYYYSEPKSPEELGLI